MIKFDVFYDRGYSEYSSIKEKLRKDFLEDVLPKNILKGWVGVKNRNRGRKMFETLSRAFVCFCKCKHSENIEPTEIQSS